MTSSRRILGSLSILGLNLAMFVLLEVAVSFGSHDRIWYVTWPKYKNRINSRSLHLSPLKPTPTGRVYWEAKSVAWICWNLRYWKSYGVIKFLWGHNFFNNKNFNKSVLQILHLNALLLPVGFCFIGVRCKLCEFIRFLWSDHVTYQIWSWLPKVKAISNKRNMVKN